MQMNLTTVDETLEGQAKVKGVVLDGAYGVGVFGPLQFSDIIRNALCKKGAVVVGVIDQNKLGVVFPVHFLEIAHIMKKAGKADNSALAVVSSRSSRYVSCAGLHQFTLKFTGVDWRQVASVPILAVGVQRK